MLPICVPRTVDAAVSVPWDMMCWEDGWSERRLPISFPLGFAFCGLRCRRYFKNEVVWRWFDGFCRRTGRGVFEACKDQCVLILILFSLVRPAVRMKILASKVSRWWWKTSFPYLYQHGVKLLQKNREFCGAGCKVRKSTLLHVFNKHCWGHGPKECGGRLMFRFQIGMAIRGTVRTTCGCGRI